MTALATRTQERNCEPPQSPARVPPFVRQTRPGKPGQAHRTRGVELRTIMEILGHSRISTTVDIYAHVLPTLQRDAASRMEAILTGS